GEPDQAAVAKSTELFHRAAKILDDQLRNRKFVTGNTLTVADFSLGAALNYTEMAHLPLAPYREIGRWHDTLSALPAWQKTVAQSALPATFAA
ncbi:MAG TPA: glutathione S-transferase C-terminal domain-containing protein, partial [Methylocella sp.]|nr:glutathione S-transferase C-terminal domain-containing protein [Methylocella sp.]